MFRARGVGVGSTNAAHSFPCTATSKAERERRGLLMGAVMRGPVGPLLSSDHLMENRSLLVAVNLSLSKEEES